MKSETFHPPSTPSQTAARVSQHTGVVGSDGPVQVSYPYEFAASHAQWHETMESIGVASNDSHLAGSHVGCWTSVCSVDPRSLTRSYAGSAYFQPSVGRPNLYLLTEAEAREILLEPGSGSWSAKGVRFVHRGQEYKALASREVILSAGSIQSPQILELSGIGNEKILSASGVEVKVPNPNVGENLQDHLSE
jgi:choline dehydrogenase-like flavoprotein